MEIRSVALINPPQHTKYPQPPMGLALLGAILERGGYSVNIIDLNILPTMNVSSLVDSDVVGLTAMTPTINSTFEVIRNLKQIRPSVVVILGGVHATLLPEETMRTAEDIDIIVRGEGDELFIDLLKVLHDNNPTMPVQYLQGIDCRLKSNILHTPDKGKNVDMDSLPFLAYHLLPWQKYRPHPPHGKELPWLPLITSRGCPYHCAFCSKAVFGNKFRAQSPQRVVDEVAYHQKRFGVKEVSFYDDVFTLDRKRAYGIVEEILKRGIKVCWTCETRANLVGKDLLRHMKKAGCYSVAYGIESASQDILDVIDKDITLEQSEEAVRLTREAGIQTIGYFMVGSPNETPETIQKTIMFAKKLKLDYAQFAITTPFPGTKLFEYYKDGKGDMNIPWESFVYAGTGNKVSPIFESKALSRGDIEQWVSRAYKEFYLRPSYVWQRLSRIRSMGDVKVLAKGLNMLRGM